MHAQARYVLLIGIALAASGSRCAGAEDAWRVRLVMNNDYLTNNTVDDDFYTFGARLEVTWSVLTVRLEENAFTDRQDGLRFDETYLTVGRVLPTGWVGSWDLWIEAGVAHVGEGLLGQNVQNEIHELFNIAPVRLDYVEGRDDYYLHVRAELGRQWRVTRQLTWGPQIGMSATPGFRWNAMAGVRAIWRPSESIAVDVTVGRRFSDTEMPLLAPHLRDDSPAAQVRIELPLGFIAEWSLNRYGTDREHVSFGYTLGAPVKKRVRRDVAP